MLYGGVLVRIKGGEKMFFPSRININLSSISHLFSIDWFSAHELRHQRIPFQGSDGERRKKKKKKKPPPKPGSNGGRYDHR